jgi:hypothetical protein
MKHVLWIKSLNRRLRWEQEGKKDATQKEGHLRKIRKRRRRKKKKTVFKSIM